MRDKYSLDGNLATNIEHSEMLRCANVGTKGSFQDYFEWY